MHFAGVVTAFVLSAPRSACSIVPAQGEDLPERFVVWAPVLGWEAGRFTSGIGGKARAQLARVTDGYGSCVYMCRLIPPSAGPGSKSDASHRNS